MPAIDNAEIETLNRRRRRPLRSKTSDELFRFLSICSSLFSDKDGNNVGSITNDHVPSDCTNIKPNDTSCQEEISMQKTRTVLDIQEEGLCNKHAESAEHVLNISGEKEDLSHKVDKGTEEGEISGEFMDLIPEDDTQCIEKTVIDLENLIGVEPVVRNVNDIMPLLTDTIEDVDKDTMGVVNMRSRSLVDYSEIAVNVRSSAKDGNAQNNRKRRGPLTRNDKTNKKAKKSVDPPPVSENLRSLGENLDDTSKKVIDASANKDASNEKKKKRTLTKERKAKKKRKDRIKRAEKNRKLGVKRLKLKPVIKEKKVTYCRHYLKGRCHEGDKCKFSHDMVPETKSKPCCHFARHACMKGDDCPFDHQLSKYPCNNHLTNGFCTRGSDCMFSHQAQPTEAVLNPSNEMKPEQQKPHSSSGSETIDTKSCSLPTFVPSNTRSNLANATPSLPVRPPKGISFLSLRENPPLPSPTVDGVIKEIAKTPPIIQNFKEITKMPPVVPRGINFLSFGKKPGLDHSNIGKFIKTNNASGKRQFGNMEGSGSKSESPLDAMKVDVATDKQNSSVKPVPILPFMSTASQKAIQSTLDFALKFESGVKTKRPL